MGRTINGKSAGQIIEELSAPFKKEQFRENYFGYFYLPVEAFRERMDEVVGIMNYDVITTAPEVVTVGTRPQVLLRVSVTIRDDSGNVFVTKESPGGAAVIISNTTNEADSVKNDAESAAQDGFKRCCKLLGMAGKQLKEMRGSGSGTIPGSASSETPTELFKVTLLEEFQSLGKDGYAAQVVLEGGEEIKLVIWKDAQDKIEETLPMDDFLRLSKRGKQFCLYGKRNTFTPKKGRPQNQLIMESPFRSEQ